MTATNHVLTGAVIGSVVHQPLLALPLAFLSHFVCDALPHFGNEKNWPLDSRQFAIWLGSDCVLAFCILLFIFSAQPEHWFVIMLCGILAASPDLMWVPRFLRELKGDKTKPTKLKGILKLHHYVQWSQTPWGLLLEIPWLIAFMSILLHTMAWPVPI